MRFDNHSAPEQTARILLLEDNPGDARLVREVLDENATNPVKVVHVTRLSDAEGRLDGGGFDAALVDLGVPDSTGLDALESLHAVDGELPIVVVSGNDDLELRRRALSMGAADWVPKDDTLSRLARCVDSAIAQARMARELEAARRDLRENAAQLAEFMLDASEPMLVLSDELHVLFANQAAARALRIEPERLVGVHLPLPVGQASGISRIARTEDGAPVLTRSYPMHWNRQPAWMVALESPEVPKRFAGPAKRDTFECNAALAGEASEILARVQKADACVDAATDPLLKATELLEGASSAAALHEVRTFVREMLNTATSSALETRTELASIQRNAAMMIRALNRGGRLRERSAFDVLVRRACKRSRASLPRAVHIHTEPGTCGLLVPHGDDVVALTEDLLVGLGDLAGRHCPEGAQLRVKTCANPDGATLALTVVPREPRSGMAAQIVQALVSARPRGRAALGTATRTLRSLEGDVRIAEREDGSLWIQVHLPDAPG